MTFLTDWLSLIWRRLVAHLPPDDETTEEWLDRQW